MFVTMTIEEKINEVITEYTRIFGNDDCFKTWVENINNGEKYIVWCSCRYTWGYNRKTQRVRTTIYGQNFLKNFSKTP